MDTRKVSEEAAGELRILFENSKILDEQYPELSHYFGTINMAYLRHVGRSELEVVSVLEALDHVRRCPDCWACLEEERTYLLMFVATIPEIDKYKLF